MKLLKVKINNYKLCEENFNISLTPLANKSKEDKEYELSEIDENLYIYNTLGIVGKNASGKTTSIEVLLIAYDILSNFKIKNTLEYLNNSNNLKIEFFFYHDGYLYFYKTDLNYQKENDYVLFQNEELYKTKYYKSYASELYNLDKYEKININKELPNDTSILYYILKEIKTRCFSYNYKIENIIILDEIIELYNSYNPIILNDIIELLDSNIKNIKMENKNKFIITYKNNKKEEKNKKELYNILSSGTIKGLYLYLDVLISLKHGVDLVIDEIEIHFHKTLVENIINLYKDKRINKKNATLIFSTHCCELLDLFNRYDNIYITTNEEKIKITNAYTYNIRNELSKSKRFYDNTFNTTVNYESLMKVKKHLLKWNI